VAFPASVQEPVYPARADAGGVVLIEARVNASGAVTATRVIGSAPPFDQPALDAARRWRFRPARGADTYAYLIFGFPQPVVTGNR
jgi:TonB family protein